MIPALNGLMANHPGAIAIVIDKFGRCGLAIAFISFGSLDSRFRAERFPFRLTLGAENRRLAIAAQSGQGIGTRVRKIRAAKMAKV